MADIAHLCDSLQKALQRQNHSEALRLYGALANAEPADPRWPHRRGELEHRVGQHAAAVESFSTAVDLYTRQGFVARAAALAKMVINIDPTRTDVIARVNPVVADKLHLGHRASAPPVLSDRASLLPPGLKKKRRTTMNDLLVFLPDEPFDLRLSGAELQKPLAQENRTVELEDGEIELIDVEDALAADALPSPRRKTAEQLAALPAMPLFAETSKDALGHLLAEARLVSVRGGEFLFHKGAPADALYVLVEGEVDILSPSRNDIRVSEGGVVGERALLHDSVHELDVLAAIGGVRALAIPRATLARVVQEDDALGETLLHVLSRRLLVNLLEQVQPFSSLDSVGRLLVSETFRVERYLAGTEVIHAGAHWPGAFCVVAGTLRLGDRTLSVGHVVGVESLDGNERTCAAGLVAEQDVVVLELRRRGWAKVAVHFHLPATAWGHARNLVAF